MNEITLYRKNENLIFKKQVELLDLEAELKNSELYKRVEQVKKELEALKKESENAQNSIITIMLERDINYIEDNTTTLKLKNTARDSVEVIDMQQIPLEYLRKKVEVDKNGILKLYRETGVLIPGINIIKEPKYKLEIKKK